MIEFRIPQTGEAWQQQYGALYEIVGLGVDRASGDAVVVIRARGQVMLRREFDGLNAVDQALAMHAGFKVLDEPDAQASQMLFIVSLAFFLGQSDAEQPRYVRVDWPAMIRKAR